VRGRVKGKGRDGKGEVGKERGRKVKGNEG
jgi:hypothetical protein